VWPSRACVQVVSFAGELLKNAEDLLHTGLHTSEIVAGYKTAFEKALDIMPTLTSHTVRSPPPPLYV
jgi:T-complex protein 1 subunit theta